MSKLKQAAVLVLNTWDSNDRHCQENTSVYAALETAVRREPDWPALIKEYIAAQEEFENDRGKYQFGDYTRVSAAYNVLIKALQGDTNE